MKVLSWNIHAGKNIEGVITELKKQNADIICLQEVKNTRNHYQTEQIAKELNLNYLYCKAFTTDRHEEGYDLGNAILAKEEISEQECVFLSTLADYKGDAETEPRTAVKVKVGELHIISTHLGYSNDLTPTDIQITQTQNLLPLINKTKCILSGDFNTGPRSQITKMIEQHMTNTDLSDTPTRFERKEDKEKQDRIDFIFASPDIQFSSFKIHLTKASDHAALTVKLE